MPKVLVVDDHPDAREVVGEMLQIHGHSAAYADSVEAAWKLISQNAPDAVIVDQRLPGGERGTDLLKRMRQDPALANIPIVLCSGDRMNNDAETNGAWEVWLKGSDDVYDGITRLTERLKTR
jgi:CheY-like chemotaxis protein